MARGACGPRKALSPPRQRERTGRLTIHWAVCKISACASGPRGGSGQAANNKEAAS
jgi:hypothetical protein